MGRHVEGDPDRSAAIYVAVISALIAGGHANHDPWLPVTYIGNLGRKSLTFIVDGTGSRWQVTGTTGVWALS
jgi:hypothetical protein